MPGRRWTRDEDAALLDGVGVFSLSWFRRRAGKTDSYPNAPLRSRDSIYARARRLIGTAALTRGTYTLAGAAKHTGYTRGQIQRAQVALGQKWKRLSPRGPYLVTFDQLDEIVSWLRQDYWCAKLRLYGCVICGDSHRPPRGMGLCAHCYGRQRRALQAAGLPTRLPALRDALKARPSSAGLAAAVAAVERGWALTTEQMHAVCVSS